MKVTKVLKLAGAALIVATSLNAWSQTSADSSQPGGMAASAPSMKAMKKEDRALARNVRRALDKNNIKANDIIVRAKGSTVWLEGTVPSEDQIDGATGIAQKVSGVNLVKNSLSVKEEGR